jgi:peptidoglycan hydrolase CwlO-like protein
MTNNDENIKNKIDKINSLHMDILNYNLNNQNQIYTDLFDFKKELGSKFDDIDNKMKFLYNKLNHLDEKVNSITNNLNHQKISMDEIYNSVNKNNEIYGSINNNNEIYNSINKNNENIQNIYSQIELLQTIVNELKIKNHNYELEMKQINKLEINSFDNITKDDKDIKINKKCFPFL